MFLNYQEALRFLYEQLPMYQRVGAQAFKKDLTNTLKLAEATGNAHKKLKCIHVAGTNGKGSVSHILAAAIQAHGYKVGLYTSPHYTDFRERIKINGVMIEESFVLDFINQYYHEVMQIQPSFFEMTVVLSFSYFAAQLTDYVVVEVGLGGRLDSTNIIHPLISVITNIGLDHTDMLGNTLQQIAFEKAGIIKHQIPVCIGEWHPDTEPVFTQKANENNAPFFFADRIAKAERFKHQPLSPFFNWIDSNSITHPLSSDLLGFYQMKNLNTALCTLFFMKENKLIALNHDKIFEGIQSIKKLVGMKGRMDIIANKPLIIFDSAHNADGIKVLLNEFAGLSFRNIHFVYGTVKDKDLNTIFPLLPKKAKYYFCHANNLPRAKNSDELAEEAKKYNLQGEAHHSVFSAFYQAQNQASPEDIIIVAGSIFILGELYAMQTEHL